MSALSFVALSMQTTHLAPATVSQVEYLKVVDGNITRRDTIAVIPPTVPSERAMEPAPDAISWEEALSQLSMVIGKLPIVSFYRDADKEIFQAASRHSDVTPPAFQWLDCRALARKLLPDLPDHQLSTVLSALDLYDDHADSRAVEQTAHIIQQFAQQYDATAVSELWGDLYDQPDDLLGLEAALAALSAEHTEPDTAAHDSDQLAVDNKANEQASPDGAVIVSTKARAGDNESSPEDGEPHRAGQEKADKPDHGDLDISEVNIVFSQVEDETVSAEEEDAVPDETESAEPAFQNTADEAFDDELGDSTAQSVIETAHLEQPEFLKISESEGDTTAPFDEDGTADDHEEDDPGQFRQEAPFREIEPPALATTQSETVHDASSQQNQEFEPHRVPAYDEEPEQGQATETPDRTLQSDVDESEDPDDAGAAEALAAATETASTAKPPAGSTAVRASETPATTTTAPFTTQSVAVLHDEQRQQTEARSKTSSKSGRFWAVLGIIFFGVLTFAGIGMTVMAALLFFTTNDLLLETKIAGVILTGAITLLSLLMTALSYRSYR